MSRTVYFRFFASNEEQNETRDDILDVNAPTHTRPALRVLLHLSETAITNKGRGILFCDNFS